MYQIFLFLNAIPSLYAATVKWVPDASYNLAINFRNSQLPCSKQTVVFPEVLNVPITLNSTSAGGFILPLDGELILDDGVINLGPDPSDVNCTETNTYFFDRSGSWWAQADVWESTKFNEATPDAERMPCFDDTVEFPIDTRYSVFLPEETQVVRKLKIGDTEFSTAEFLDYIISKHNQERFVMNEIFSPGVNVKFQECQSRSGCQCQKIPLQIDCGPKMCPIPSCVYPIKPEGHCCKICGGAIKFLVDQSFDMSAFKEFVDKIVESYGKGALVYHIGKIYSNTVQLVVVDKNTFVGTSAEVVNAINNRIAKHFVLGERKMAISGSPLDEAGMAGKIFISTFFVVAAVMGGIYVFYYKLPEMGPAIRLPLLGHRSGIFSRFQRRSDSVVFLTRQDSTPVISSESTAFRNPLYDSKRSRSHSEETIADED